jgi:hypothetical protein
MEKRRQRSLNSGIAAAAILIAGILFASYTPAIAADRSRAQGFVDKARVTFSEFMRDPNYTWVRENIDRAKGVWPPRSSKEASYGVAPGEPVSSW